MTNVWHQIELITKWWGVQVLEECSADNTALKLIDCEISDPYITTIHITWNMETSILQNFTLSHIILTTPHWVYEFYFHCHNIPETLPMLHPIYVGQHQLILCLAQEEMWDLASDSWGGPASYNIIEKYFILILRN